MPTKPCREPGCAALVTVGYCATHAHRLDARGTRQKKYDRRSWRDGVRKRKAARNPLCEMCLRDGLVVSMHAVDHIDGDVENDANDNLMSLCVSHHSRKTAEKDGGFGNPVRRDGAG